MKIAFINIYGGINRRGAESFSNDLANRLVKKHQVVIYQAGKKLPEQKTKTVSVKSSLAQPQETFSKTTLRKIIKYLFLDPANLSIFSFTIKLLPELLKGKFNLIIPLNGFWQVLLLKIFQPFLKYKILITGHSGPGWDERWNLYLKPSVFIATTEPTLRWAKQTCSWTKVELIPYGIDAALFNQSESIMFELQKPIILCPSALVPYKRVELAIKAVSKLEKASLLVLGKGKLESELQELGKRKLGNRFMLTSVPYNKMPSYYKAADIVTLPSSPQENSPMIFLESLAAGKMVITTDTPRNRWMLKEAGYYCDPTNIHNYRKALEEGLKLAENRGTKKNITKALNKFNWDKVINQYETIIKLFTEENHAK